MRRHIAAAGFALAVAAAGFGFSVVPSATTLAATDGPTFLVPANDGYGMSDCVQSGSACGQVVADAWCEAQGFARSASYGMAEPAETTASTGSVAGRAISITCTR